MVNTRSSTILSHMSQTLVAGSYSIELLLILLSLAVGLIDAALFIDDHLFVSNQTGNTVFLAVGALAAETRSFINLRHVGLSLGVFLSGCLVLGQLGNRFGTRKRAWVFATSLTQTALMFIATALRYWYAPTMSSNRQMSVITLLSFASGAQIAMARGLGVVEIPTGMITSAWVDLIADPRLFQLHGNRPRNRRFFFILALLIGAFIGAAAHAYCTPALPMLLASIIKAVVTIGTLFAEAEKNTGEVKGEV